MYLPYIVRRGELKCQKVVQDIFSFFATIQPFQRYYCTMLKNHPETSITAFRYILNRTDWRGFEPALFSASGRRGDRCAAPPPGLEQILFVSLVMGNFRVSICFAFHREN
jgi:hypothetical protein